MKLFRFIRNVWNSVWDFVFDGDTKGFAKHIAGYVIGVSVFGVMSYLLGLLGQWVGLAQHLSADKRDNALGLGVMMFVFLLVGMMVCLCLWDIGQKLINIWRKS